MTEGDTTAEPSFHAPSPFPRLLRHFATHLQRKLNDGVKKGGNPFMIIIHRLKFLIVRCTLCKLRAIFIALTCRNTFARPNCTTVVKNNNCLLTMIIKLYRKPSRKDQAKFQAFPKNTCNILHNAHFPIFRTIQKEEVSCKVFKKVNCNRNK